ncbi:MAG: NAD(P)-binding domain-containing protein [Burkholderiales bacterium]|nr:NAD(P)-binding domain-containing protein [Burkholderiales bacterium]
MTKSHIAVLGAGRMGCGIAQVFCAAGHPVALHDTSSEALAKAPETIREYCRLLDVDPGAAANLRCARDLEDAAAGADVVIEAVPERREQKREVFARLEAATRREALLATNTSAIPIGDIAAGLKTPERVLGMHFWNPPHLVALVEVVQASRTGDDAVSRAMALLESIGMSPVHVRRDIPGFIGNRLQHALKREAIALVAAGVCDARTLDRVVKEGFGARLAVLGPLEQSDLVGLDLTLAVHEVLIADLDRSPGPHPYLRAKVAAGETGMAKGMGFRSWTAREASELEQRVDLHLVAAARARRK